MKLAARIKSEPIGPQPIWVRVGQTRLARIFFIINFLKMIYIYIYIYDLLRFFSKSYSDHTNEDED